MNPEKKPGEIISRHYPILFEKMKSRIHPAAWTPSGLIIFLAAAFMIIALILKLVGHPIIFLFL